MPYIQCDGADLYYEDRGEGEPILFLHGVLHGLRIFEPQLAGLSEDYRVIAFDFRGHGRSEETELGHTVPQYARDLHAFIDRQDLEDVVLVGWSMGAFVSWDYVEQFGTDRIRGLVNVDIEATRYQWDDYDYGLARLEDIRTLLELAQSDQPDLIDRFAEQVFANPSAATKTLRYDEISRTPPPIQSAILFDTHTRDYRPVLWHRRPNADLCRHRRDARLCRRCPKRREPRSRSVGGRFSRERPLSAVRGARAIQPSPE